MRDRPGHEVAGACASIQMKGMQQGDHSNKANLTNSVQATVPEKKGDDNKDGLVIPAADKVIDANCEARLTSRERSAREAKQRLTSRSGATSFPRWLRWR